MWVNKALWLFVCAARGSVVSPFLTSLGSGARLQPQTPIPWGPAPGPAADVSIFVDRSRAFQAMLGFGSALTESAAFNFAQLNATLRALVLKMLFAPPAGGGNGYALGRLHMNSADFSLQTYNMANVSGDFALASFDASLTHDAKYVLPFAKAATAASGGALKLFFSPWSPPGWMKQPQPGKSAGSMINSTSPTGLLADPNVHAAWALYFVKFAQALEAAGVPAWGATIQNEPLITMNFAPPKQAYESCAYTAENGRDFLRDHLGPALASANLSNLVVLGFDWNKGQLADFMGPTLSDPSALRYLGGAAVHWYAWRSDLYLDQLARLVAEPGWDASRHVLLATEACFIKQGVADGDFGDPGNDGTGVLIGPGPPPGNGSVVVRYGVGELYLLDALGDILFGCQGWVDWNALLDYAGGPNHINRSDISAPLLVDAATQSIYVQSMYYYVGHLSRFVPPGWRRVDTIHSTGVASNDTQFNLLKLHVEQNLPLPPPNKPAEADFIVAAAFASPDGLQGAVVALNVLQRPFRLRVEDAALGAFLFTLPPRSVVTFAF
jgi:glucosylceramidase